MNQGVFSKRTTIADKVANYLIEKIVTDYWRPGERLPAEKELAATLGVSRASLREGVRTLSILGFVEIRPGDGTFVKGGMGTHIAVPLSWEMQKEEHFEELYEIRMFLEIGSVHLAAKNRKDQDIQALEDTIKQLSQTNNVEEFCEIDLNFHRHVAASSNNSVLVTLLNGTYAVLKPWILLGEEHVPEYSYRGIREHEEILKQIVMGDSQGCEAMMRQHLLSWQERTYNP